MTESYKPQKSGNQGLKKLFLYSATVLTLATTGVVHFSDQPFLEHFASVAYAAEIKHGQVIGQLNGHDVIRANTGDMGHAAFQELVDSIVENKDLSGIKYVADTISWTGDSRVINGPGVNLAPLSHFHSTVRNSFVADGFEDGDVGGYMSPGQGIAITSVGTVTNIETGEKIPVNLIITLEGAIHGADDAPADDRNGYIFVRNNSGVITIGGATMAAAGASNTGGQFEGGGGGSTGATGAGMIGYIDSFAYRADLVRQDNGQVIPDGELLMALKVSDVDGTQLATLDSQGVLAYIVSPDTSLEVRDRGLYSPSNQAFNADSTQLTSNSYVVLKAWSANFVRFDYTDGARDHLDIVTGLFGNTGFTINADKTGSVKIIKTGTLSKTTMWNKLYTLEGNTFRLTNKATGQTFEGKTNARGEVVFKDLPFGTYTVEEIAASPGFQKTFKTQEITLSAQSPKATIDGKQDQQVTVTGTNDELVGKIKIDKRGTLSGKTMWNQLYSLAGNKFRLTNSLSGKVYEITTNAQGEAEVVGMQLGEYTVEEIQSSPGFKKTFPTQKANLTQDGRLELTVSGTNDEITGKIKIIKKGTESQLKMWNALYTLEGNKFRLTNSLSGKVYEITTNAQGEAEVAGMELGDYTVEEIQSSAGFVKTFKTQTVKLRQDGKLELEVTGTNDEIKGENTLEKVDNVTGTTAHGQARLEDAEYTLYYNDDSTGSSPHKKDTPVKWSDVPNAKLLIGDKVKTSNIGGTEVDNGDNIVLNLDDKELKVAVGNLALGKYYWKETNAPEGYALDGKKHEFEITKKDDVTKNIVTPNTKSLEQIITAVISLQKIAQSDGNVSSAGLNDVTFTVTPLNDTKAEAFEVTTGIKDDEDGYAAFELVYGDWKIEEKEAPEGYALIKPVYIHMSYDDKTDLYTITASHYEDGKKPFSKRVFSQSDDAAEKNPNVKGSVAGTLSSSNFKISLSKQTYKDNEVPPAPPVEPPVTPPAPPAPPVFQPEKFNLSEADVDKTGDKLTNDDDELKDEYTDTNKDPYADKADNNDAANHNTKLVKRGQKFYYQVWMDTNSFTAEHLISAISLVDDYDEVNLTLHLDQIKGWDGQTGEDVLQHFDLADKDGQLTIQTKDSLLKDNVIDTSILPFGRYYKFEIPVTVKETAQDGVDIINTAKQFVVQYNPETKETNPPIEKPTQKRVNPLKLPVPQPHKFSVTSTDYDIDGTKLLDDDGELKDRYADTKADPYADKTNNNEDQNFNTKTVKPGDSFVYQVWVDTTPWNQHDLLQTVGAEDDYDEQNVIIDVAKIKVYIKGKDKKDVTDQFDISIKDGTLSILPKDSLKKDIDLSNGKKARVLDTTKFALGVTYQVDIPVTVKKDAKPGTDIKNTARQIFIDKDGKKTVLETETRVNPTPPAQAAPPKGFLPSTGESTSYFFYTLGGVGLVGALWLLLKPKKKGTEDSSL